MPHCPNLRFDLPKGIDQDRSQEKFYCLKTDKRLSRDTLEHICSCSYEDKFLKCELYEEKDKENYIESE